MRKTTTLFPENLSIPKGARSTAKRILQPEDLAKLFSFDTTILRGKRQFDHYIHAYRFEVLTGLRPGEVIGLRWADISADTVCIKRSINVFGEETMGKNENAVRRFALNDRTQQEIREQREISASESVFEIESLSSYSKRWARYCESNNIPHISLYELRHTFISIAKNLPAGQVKSIVGHSKNMDTFGTYGHEMNGDLQKTALQIDALFDGILK